MVVKILTDSAADIPAEPVRQYDITVIPLLIRWGEQIFRDGIDLTAGEFYKRLKLSKSPPATSLPPPETFASAYDSLAGTTDGIVAIMVSSRLSGTYNVAFQSVGLMKKHCRIEVIDSGWAALAQGLVVIKAAMAAQTGASIDEVVDVAKETKTKVRMQGTFETLEYLKRGGRIGKAQALLGGILKINPMITIKDGVIEPAGRARLRSGAIQRLYEYAVSHPDAELLALEEAACRADAEILAKRLAPKFPNTRIILSTATPVVGTHTGPGLLVVSMLLRHDSATLAE